MKAGTVHIHESKALVDTLLVSLYHFPYWAQGIGKLLDTSQQNFIWLIGLCPTVI